ncbi:MAG: hypothetical protein IM631_12580 [Cytophagales bacterium]|nr:hypothetical protein [Cytophagales bacterium]MCA6382351.1 hypothetical protein [Cytophagales bacterium]
MKKETEIYNRTENLRERINDFLGRINNKKADYFGELTSYDLIEFKMALSDINNVLTLKTTLNFTTWLTKYFNVSNDKQIEILKTIDETKPNTNGYDIELPDEKIIAEIKCIVPINGGNYYGAAQRNSILDDAIKLKRGKRNIRDTRDFIKIIGLIDLGQRTDIAIDKLCKEAVNVRTKEIIRIDRHDIVKHIKVIDNKTNPKELSTDFIYLKKVAV